jgi:hypothetical protein
MTSNTRQNKVTINKHNTVYFGCRASKSIIGRILSKGKAFGVIKIY